MGLVIARSRCQPVSVWQMSAPGSRHCSGPLVGWSCAAAKAEARLPWWNCRCGEIRMLDDVQMRAVIADDEPLARRGIRQLLASHQDVEVVGEARNGRETLHLIRTHGPDLLFLDVQMPELDGF